MPAKGLPPAHAGLVVDDRSFRWQIVLLGLLGFRAVSLEHVARALHGQATLPARPVVITFDDGYAGIYDYAFPTLHRYGYTATLFLIAEDFVHGTPPSRARAYPVVTNTQVDEMLAHGFTIGSHTISHARLTELSPTAIHTEVHHSKRLLEQVFGGAITTFCYPYGDTNPAVAAAVAEAGYRCATTTRFGRRHQADEQFLLKRISVGLQQNLAQFVYRTLYVQETH